MRKIVLLTLCLWLLLPVLTAKESLEEFLQDLPVSDIRVLEKESFYGNIYEIMFEQPIDHHNPEKGSFKQRLYISHYDNDAPVVLSTEGYSASYYYTTELAVSLKCNQIIAEHRYFGKSVPEDADYAYLTTWQAATDHHRIIEAFKKFYKDKWITTGISKGGQTVMYHAYYYPEDSDARVPYVAPLNYCPEDKRIYEFLDEVGPRKCRKRIERFQRNMLKEQERMIPAFKEFSDKKGYTYTIVGSLEKAYEYCVLEYSFAFWQWGYADCKDIPSMDAEPEKLIRHMNSVAGFDYFADEFVVEYRPFFYQALTEMGYYGYEIEKFNKVLQHVNESGFDFALPDSIPYAFNPEISREVNEYIQTKAEDFIFIYGEWDTWSATAVELTGLTNSRVFYNKKGSHRTRIRHMDFDQQEEIYALLEEFLAD